MSHARARLALTCIAAELGALWSYTLGRVLYDAGDLVGAEERLSEAMARPGTPAAAKQLLRLAQRLEVERQAGNAAFKRGEWAAAAAGYTRGLQLDPNNGRFNALLYCNRAAANARRDSLLEQAPPPRGAHRISGASQSRAGLFPRRSPTATWRSSSTRRTPRPTSAALSCGCAWARGALFSHGEVGALLAAICHRRRVRRCRQLALDDFGLARRHDPRGTVGAEAAKRSAEVRAAAAGSSHSHGYSGGSRSQHGGFAGGAGRPGHGGYGYAGSRAPPPVEKERERCHYEVLEMKPGASAAELKRAYRKLALQHHPDKNNGSDTERAAAQKRFVEVQRSYDVLSDASARARYDAERLRRGRRPGGFGGGFGGGFAAEEELFAGFYSRRYR